MRRYRAYNFTCPPGQTYVSALDTCRDCFPNEPCYQAADTGGGGNKNVWDNIGGILDSIGGVLDKLPFGKEEPPTNSVPQPPVVVQNSTSPIVVVGGIVIVVMLFVLLLRKK